jgi:hypothetical protein
MFGGLSYFQSWQSPIVSLYDAYAYPSKDNCSGNLMNVVRPNMVGFNVGYVTTTYSPNPIGWAYQAGSPFVGVATVFRPTTNCPRR